MYMIYACVYVHLSIFVYVYLSPSTTKQASGPSSCLNPRCRLLPCLLQRRQSGPPQWFLLLQNVFRDDTSSCWYWKSEIGISSGCWHVFTSPAKADASTQNAWHCSHSSSADPKPGASAKTRTVRPTFGAVLSVPSGYPAGPRPKCTPACSLHPATGTLSCSEVLTPQFSFTQHSVQSKHLPARNGRWFRLSTPRPDTTRTPLEGVKRVGGWAGYFGQLGLEAGKCKPLNIRCQTL